MVAGSGIEPLTSGFKLEDIDKAKDAYIQLVLDVFKDEGDNSF